MKFDGYVVDGVQPASVVGENIPLGAFNINF
jgi:hypothetical protein